MHHGTLADWDCRSDHADRIIKEGEGRLFTRREVTVFPVQSELLFWIKLFIFVTCIFFWIKLIYDWIRRSNRLSSRRWDDE